MIPRITTSAGWWPLLWLLWLWLSPLTSIVTAFSIRIDSPMTATKQAPQELSVRRTSALHMVLSMDPTTTTTPPTTTTLPPILVQNETLLAPLLEDYVEDYDEEEDEEEEEEEINLHDMPWQVADYDAEAIAVALASGATALEAWLTAGGDDRCLLTNGGKNKYHIAPRPVSPRAIVRGSCTCNAPTPAAYAAAQALYNRWQRRVVGSASRDASRALHEALAETMEEQRQRLAASLQVPPGTHIALVPSGSDAEYLPLAMARTLRPDARSIFNVVTQSKEIGTGSSPAAGGQYFSTHAPLMGALQHSPQTTNTQSQTWLTGFEPSRPECPEIHTCSIPARQPCGTPLDTARVTSETIDDFLHSSNDKDQDDKDDSVVTIVHGVFGGKTGLRDAVLPGSTFAWNDNGKPVLTSLGVVDACQGRFSVDELQSWLDQDSVVLFTASKFYQAPPCKCCCCSNDLGSSRDCETTVGKRPWFSLSHTYILYTSLFPCLLLLLLLLLLFMCGDMCGPQTFSTATTILQFVAP